MGAQGRRVQVWRIWYTPPKFNIDSEQMVVGKLFSYWKGNFSYWKGEFDLDNPQVSKLVWFI